MFICEDVFFHIFCLVLGEFLVVYYLLGGVWEWGLILGWGYFYCFFSFCGV